jgi:2-oxoglutarate dehydrogenase E2 component (dihydrolipoamide succinyltransferase)
MRSFSNVTEKVPSLGDSISEGTIVSWEKQPGEQVNIDDVMCIMETDKVSVDILATTSGLLVSHSAEEGDTIQVDDDLFVVDTSATGTAAAPAAEAKASEPAQPAAPPKPDAAAPPAAAPAAPAPPAKKSGTQSRTYRHTHCSSRL